MPNPPFSKEAQVQASVPGADGEARPGRRLLILRLTGMAVVGSVAGCAPSYPYGGQPYGRARPVVGGTDSDPSDGPGYGGGGQPVRRQVTDSDPNDAEGRGSGYGRPRRREVTDSDPNDGEGRGRGWR